MAVRARQLGAVWDDAWDAWTDVGDAIGSGASAVYEWFSDAGQTIGQVLKFIAPIVALWPGVGTALSVALSAAAAYACGDAIEDAVVDIASNAIPGGVPRVLFRAGASVARDAIAGRPMGQAILVAARNVAGAAGGERAVAAFDIGVTAARGENVGDGSVALARGQLAGSGPAALAAFDGGVAIARGGNAGDAVVAAGRAYIGSAGGPGALAAFDFGVAIARGKDLQDAGFAGLKALAEGNDAAERAVHFVKAMVRAAETGQSVKEVLVEELTSAWEKYGSVAREQLGSILKQWGPDFGEWGSQDLADYFGVAELVARAAQSIMRDPAHPDTELQDTLMKTGVQSAIEKYGPVVVASRQTNATYAETKAEIHSSQLETALRIPAYQLSYAAAKAEQPWSREGMLVAAASKSVAGSYAADAAAQGIVREAPAVVAAPSSRRSTLGQDVLLGVTIAGALGALYWWATSNGKAA